MRENNKIKSFAVLFLTLFITISLSKFKINDGDRVWFTLNVQDEANKTVTVDIAKLNPIKYYLQPGTISLYGRIKNPTGQRDLNAEFIGTEGFVSQGSKKSRWTKLRPTDRLDYDRQGNIRISIEMRLPYSEIRQHKIKEADLNIRSEGETIARVHFNIINTKY